MSDQPPLPPEPAAPQRQRRGGAWLWALGAVLLVAAAIGGAVVLTGGEDEAKAQTVSFQQSVDVGPDPFTDEPTDKKGKRTVKVTPSSTEVGAGPFGGTGSDLVCDRDLLIRSLKARPERLAEWARVRGIEQTIKAVGEYIARLHPVTLTRDTRVTNYSFVNGRAVGYQAILAAGTAVLVDDYGNPVVRCRCGNPLAKPVYIPTATCIACPPRYTPPPPCPYTEETIYRRRWYPRTYYGNAQYDEIFVRRFRSACYRAYPDPPPVTITDIYDPDLRPRPRRPRPSTTTVPDDPLLGDARASFSPSSGPVCRSYTLYVSGFPPRRTLPITLVRPDGVTEGYSLTTGGGGSGSHTFGAGPNCARDVQGVYTATVRDPRTGETAQASVNVRGGGSTEPEHAPEPTPAPGTETGTGDTYDPDTLLCDPPRSQAEYDECVRDGLIEP